MAGIDFVVPVGTDYHQVLHVRSGQQLFEQIERRRVEPLQIVEKQSQRMFWPSEDADESTEHQLETALGVLCWNFRDWWLFSDNEPQFGNQIHNQLSVRI